ncbi:MAG: hypothetical protein H5U39_06385 [Deferribacterales bacterium]|jgi:hypothetical protein|nr:hypothetical protein [Deferribacterales bacterium]
MKRILLFILICISTNLFSQEQQAGEQAEKRNSVTIGILQGGGSLVGADFEFLLSDRFGFQLGAGLIGFGGGLNYHFKPSIRSSFISLQYWNQGIGSSFAQNAIGSTFVYRGKKWFTFQIGLGVPLQKGPAMPDDYELPPVMLLYSIGAYIPF